MAHRSGFVCLAGQPNVGKSTLLNRLVGKPISITANKPQTTRNRILGVQHGPDFQVVFVDTPGIHEARDAFSSRLVAYARDALQDVDLVLLMVAPPFPPDQPPAAQEAEQTVFAAVQAATVGSNTPVLLLMNKVDLVPEAAILAGIAAYAAQGPFSEIVPISAEKGRGVAHLQSLIEATLPEGPPYFEPDQVTDQSEAQVVGELIRQELFRRTHQELPYSSAVKVERMDESSGTLRIAATIVVERESQKGMVIGKGGQRLKAVGSAARHQIQALLGVAVHLELHVRVLKNWSKDARRIAELGYPELE